MTVNFISYYWKISGLLYFNYNTNTDYIKVNNIYNIILCLRREVCDIFSSWLAQVSMQRWIISANTLNNAKKLPGFFSEVTFSTSPHNSRPCLPKIMIARTNWNRICLFSVILDCKSLACHYINSWTRVLYRWFKYVCCLKTIMMVFMLCIFTLCFTHLNLFWKRFVNKNTFVLLTFM